MIDELQTLWKAPIYSIRKVLLSDNIWYDITKEYCECSDFIVYGASEKDPKFFELRTWVKGEEGRGVCIRGLVSQIKLIDTNWS